MAERVRTGWSRLLITAACAVIIPLTLAPPAAAVDLPGVPDVLPLDTVILSVSELTQNISNLSRSVRSAWRVDANLDLIGVPEGAV
ncbi:hypothetical protein [Streptomyces sp. ISL-11]|uniref:hypothetical protein n=1 Tax=Streptomyces sp. ISL-11 TaxID=2819174 RepID=UPI001BE69D8D|nr:hypothetical protein [Streptomyces sp. ISL-11]MBT2384441.1 hypothetical protein [Streptomyces sp. ISL-11]